MTKFGLAQADGTRLAAGCFDGTVALWRCDYDDDKLLPYQSKEHNLAVFAIVWNRWNRNLFATRSRDEVYRDFNCFAV